MLTQHTTAVSYTVYMCMLLLLLLLLLRLFLVHSPSLSPGKPTRPVLRGRGSTRLSRYTVKQLTPEMGELI